MKRTETRAAAGMTLLTAALLGLSGCTNPDDFTSLRNDCPEGTFDLPERDSFCSGEANMAEVTFQTPLGFDAGAPVRVVQRAGFMVLSGKVEGAQELAVLSVPAPGDTLSQAGYWKRNVAKSYPELEGITNVESLALLEDKLILVHDGGALKVLRSEKLLTNGRFICADPDSLTEEDQSGEEGEPSPLEPGSDVDERPEEGTDSDVVSGDPLEETPRCQNGRLVDETMTLPEGEACVESDEQIAEAMELNKLFKDCEGPIGVQSFEPFQLSGAARAQRFAILNTTCGAAVLGRSGVDSAAPAIFLSVEGAADIKFDPIGQRLFVAEGAQGLRVRYTGSISQNLSTFNSFDKEPEELSAKVVELNNSCGSSFGNESPTIGEPDNSSNNPGGNNNNVGGNDNNGNNNGNNAVTPDTSPGELPEMFVSPPTPIYDTEQAQAVIDPSLQDQINVTSVNFDADRVFFINGAGADAPTTSLVVARLTPANTLESRESLELPVQDLEEAAVNYKLTPLRDNLLLVVREATSGLQAWVVDAPVGRPPRRVITLPTDAGTLAVIARSERVSVVSSSGMQSWTLRATGDLR